MGKDRYRPTEEEIRTEKKQYQIKGGRSIILWMGESWGPEQTQVSSLAEEKDDDETVE